MSDYDSKIHQLAIIGGGPAAHTAAIYAARAELKPLLFEGFMAGGVTAGGQLTTTSEVENFPGFPNGISGSVMMSLLREQSIRFGTKVITETINKANFSKQPFRLWREGNDKEILTKTVIIATGATAKKLDIEGGDTYWQKGISACAVCDGALPIFRNKILVVVGGGDSAAEEALFLTKYASKVHLVHRRDSLRSSQIMQKRILANPKINICWNSEIVAITGDNNLLSTVKIKNNKENTSSDINASGLFFAIGHLPNTAIFQNQLQLDSEGYIKVKSGSTHTNIDGIFACGDVQDRKYRQAITAAGTGCMAALDAEHWLTETNSNHV